jgi:hypothetical protein
MRRVLLLLCGVFVACGARTGLGVGATRDAATPVDASPDAAQEAGPDAAPDVEQPPVVCPPAPSPVLLASGIKPTYDWQLAVDATSVYMADGQQITRFPKCGPGPKQTLTGVEPNSGRVLVDAGTVYFLDIVLGGSVKSVPTSGGIVTTLATAPKALQPEDLIKVGDTLFYLLVGGPASGVSSVPAGGGASVFVGPATGVAVAVDVDSVYFIANTGGSKWALQSRPRAGGAATYLADSSNVGAIAVDDTTVYFTGWAGKPGFVSSVPKKGGPVTALSTSDSFPVYVLLDPPYLYWVDEGQAVKRVLETGGTPEVLASGNVAGIALDATSLYYSISGGTQGNGTLYRVDK